MAPAATATKSRAAKGAAANASVETPAEEVTTATEAPAAEAPKQETESQKRNRLRNEAERVIINRHKAEFEDVATALFAENGLKFNKRMTEEQKAKAKVDELIAKHPELREQLLASLLPAQAVASAAPVASAPAVAYEPSEPDYASYGEDQFAGQADGPWADQREGE